MRPGSICTRPRSARRWSGSPPSRTPTLRANASFDLPFWITFNPSPVEGYFPILFGGGVEYLLQHDLALTARLKMGPTIGTVNRTENTFFTLYLLVGFAYRF